MAGTHAHPHPHRMGIHSREGKGGRAGTAGREGGPLPHGRNFYKTFLNLGLLKPIPHP